MLRKVRNFCIWWFVIALSAAAENDDVYVVKNIEVDRSAETVIEAQTLAFQDARIAASKIIIERLTLESDRKRNREVNIDPRLAERLVAAVDIENEVRGGGRYRGTLSVIFNQVVVRNYLESRGIPYVDTQAPRTLLIPTFKPIDLPPIASYPIAPVIKKKIEPLSYVIIPWHVPAVAAAFEGFFPDLDQVDPYIVTLCDEESGSSEICAVGQPPTGYLTERRDSPGSLAGQGDIFSGFDDTYGVASNAQTDTSNSNRSTSLERSSNATNDSFITPLDVVVDARFKGIEFTENGDFSQDDSPLLEPDVYDGVLADNIEDSSPEVAVKPARVWPSWEELGYIFEPHPEEVWRNAWPDTIDEVLSPLSKARLAGYSQYSSWNDLLPEIFAFEAQWAVIAQLDGEEGAFSVTLTRITSDSRDLVGVIENVATYEEAVTAVSKHLDKVWQLEFYAESKTESSRLANVRYDSINEWNAIRTAVSESQLVKDFQVVSLARDGALIQFTYSGDSDRLANDMTQNGVSLEIDGRAWIIRTADTRLR